MKKIPEYIKVECRRLRKEERLSVDEIQKRLGLDQATISFFVKDILLTPVLDKVVVKKSKRKSWNLGFCKSRGERSKFFDQIEKNKLTSMQKANVAEAAILFRLCLYGFKIFGSPFDSDVEDWLVIVPHTKKVKKVQVKVAYKKQGQGHGLPVISVRRNHGKRERYQQSDFDFLVGYDLYSDKAYVFSFEETLKCKASISICVEAEEAWEKFMV